MEAVNEKFGNRLRVRVCGVLFNENEEILLVNHRGLTQSGNFLAPPGGGVEFGESLEEALKREFQEETGLKIDVGKHLFIYEIIRKPLHAIEVFFDVKSMGGRPKKGFDPEMEDNQIIKAVSFYDKKKLRSYKEEEIHAMVNRVDNMKEISQTSGYFFNG